MKILGDLSQLNKDQLDGLEEIFNRGFKEGSRHVTPAPETLERLNKLETGFSNLTEEFVIHSKIKEEKLELLMADLKEIKADIKKYNDAWGNASFMFKFFVGLGSLVMFFGGAYIMFRDIFSR